MTIGPRGTVRRMRPLFGVALVSPLVLMITLAAGHSGLASAFVVCTVGALLLLAITDRFGRRPEDAVIRNGTSTAEVAALGFRALAVCYGWGALAMQGGYLTPLTGLRWQHAWQYAAAMLLLGLLNWRIASTLETRAKSNPEASRKSAITAATLQVLLAGSGGLFLVASGKLLTQRADWFANRIFIAGAFLVFAVAGATAVRALRVAEPSR